MELFYAMFWCSYLSRSTRNEEEVNQGCGRWRLLPAVAVSEMQLNCLSLCLLCDFRTEGFFSLICSLILIVSEHILSLLLENSLFLIFGGWTTLH